MNLPKNNIPSNVSIKRLPGEALTSFIRESSASGIAVIVDENTKKYCYPLVRELLVDPVLIEIPAGERFKVLETCSSIWQQLTDARFDRNALVINLGGGVIGDMGGFCASTYKRGIRFINIPTTLLAQVDASVGGKLGIDFMGFKNHIGLFQEPEHVFIFTGMLTTLPPEELRSGFAEVIKHHLIADRQGWKELIAIDWQDQPWERIIPHSVAIKSKIVAEDPREGGRRKVLNVGHTLGHAIESFFLSTDQPVLHGEGVAAGIICENYIAFNRGMLSRESKEEIEQYVFSQFGTLRVKSGDIESITKLAIQDKKNQGNSIRAVLLRNVGTPEWDHEIHTDEIQNALKYYSQAQI